MPQRLAPIPLDAIRAAGERIRGVAVRTPLLPLGNREHDSRILVKLENLQPIGSFKIRNAASAMSLAGRDALAAGVYTASAGNMAQGVAWCAREFGIPCRVVVPDTAPATKLEAITRLGGAVVKVPFDRWWQTLIEHRYPGIDGVFIHPFADPGVMAGTGTIGLELWEDSPDIDTVLVPWGGGGLACGIASALRALRPATRVYAVEVVDSAPLSASFASGTAATITPNRTFIDGIGGKSVTEEMWTLARSLLAGVVTVTVAEVARAVKLIAESNHVIAEGAGAASVAAGLARVPGSGTTACIVSGGNIDTGTLATILRGEIP